MSDNILADTLALIKDNISLFTLSFCDVGYAISGVIGNKRYRLVEEFGGKHTIFITKTGWSGLAIPTVKITAQSAANEKCLNLFCEVESLHTKKRRECEEAERIREHRKMMDNLREILLCKPKN